MFSAARIKSITALLTLLLVTLLPGCINVPISGDFSQSYQRNSHHQSRIAERLEAANIDITGEQNAAVRLVDTGYEAWEDRLRLIQLADETLDLQYFSWDTDEAGIVMLSHVIDAADRGVRVRLLIDDMMAVDQSMLAYAQAHKRINVRLFNPFSSQYVQILMRPFEWLAKDRLNVRMHNKLMIADNTVAIVGGRNIENRYFWVDGEFNHRDLDILLAGPLTQDVSNSFDEYWNSDWAVPIAELESIPGRNKAKKFYQRMRKFRELEHIETMFLPAQPTTLADYDLGRDLVAVKAEFTADKPGKVEHREKTHYNELRELITENTAQELLIGMAYVIPSKQMLADKQALVDQGVSVKLLTNSMASIDFPAAFSGYLANRNEMIDLGMELYEYAVDADYQRCLLTCGRGHMSYHSKLLVLDNRISYVGSMNYDPRSIDFNTEAGVVIYNEEVSRRVAEVFYRDAGTHNSWRVTHASPTTWSRPGEEGKQEVVDSEPESSAFSSMGVLLWHALVPLRDQY